jgi:hypothetical protein
MQSWDWDSQGSDRREGRAKTYADIVRAALQEQKAEIKLVLSDEWVVPGGHGIRVKETVAAII